MPHIVEKKSSENQLSQETSPYLLQHQNNPVHWWSWGEEALREAEKSGKPILLSIGYAACHWCHVMAHESFEDQETADIMNELFVNIKVDREERPDIDAIYMAALHVMGEHGGWPLTMFLTAKGAPFWGGTYFPKEEGFGRPTFITVLKAIAKAYAEDAPSIGATSQAILDNLRAKKTVERAVGPDLDEATIAESAERLTALVDFQMGGIRGAPKFPQSSFFEFLWAAGLRFHLPQAREAVKTTLLKISQGGIYDHLKGGIARYSVDDRWLAPHFEKMLYDNGQFIALASEVWRQTRHPLLAVRIEECVDWLLSEMVAEGGGFASSLDADSEGEEGTFYVWEAAEITEILGAEDALFFAARYDVTAQGNWQGKTILNRLNGPQLGSFAEEDRLKELCQKLLNARQRRVRPGWDDKVLADWNGLAITALARASSVFSRADWLGAALRAYDFIVTHMSDKDRLFHSARGFQAKAPATASDYANMICAALALTQATGEKTYLTQAERWATQLENHYWDPQDGGYYFTADDTKDLIVRTKSATDDATPNANAVMASNLMALYLRTGDQAYHHRAKALVKAFRADITGNIFAHAGFLNASLDVLLPIHLVIMVKEEGDEADEMIEAFNQISLPGTVAEIVKQSEQLPEISPAKGKYMIDGKVTAYLCVGATCSEPITEPQALIEVVKELGTLSVEFGI